MHALPKTNATGAPPRVKQAGFLQSLGPGLVTGAADDDPSGIATYSQVGAQFGYGLAWTIPFSFPLLAVIQAVSARIGCVTGYGIAQNLRRHYSPWLLRAVILLLLVANVINLGADLGAMGAALGLLIGGPELLYTVLFGVVCILLETFISYARYAAVLKWATLCLFTYVGVAFTAHVPWGSALYGTFVPHLVFDAPHAMAIVAVLGTTISPYLFFWQAGQEVEELHRRHVKALCITPRDAGPELSRIRTDTIVGMGFSHLVALFIIFATAATLNASGVTDIQTSSQGGRGAAADRRRVHIRAVRGRHHRDRHVGRTGAGRLRGLRSERAFWLDGRPRPPAQRGEIVLCHDCGGHARRRRAELHTH
jgi:NRAMP (natural resistance-associated macrophage protein)-like metal ion transporter